MDGRSRDEGLPSLAGERVVLRPVRPDDAPALAEMLAEPEAARWLGQGDGEDVREEIRSEPSFVILIDDSVAGWLQVHEEAEPDYPSVAFDILVRPDLRGRGLGREALSFAIRHYIDRGHHRFTIDPAVDNARAIRSYTAVGFKPVGVMRAYERPPDGTLRDGLLMDLLAGEFDG